MFVLNFARRWNWDFGTRVESITSSVEKHASVFRVRNEEMEISYKQIKFLRIFPEKKVMLNSWNCH